MSCDVVAAVTQHKHQEQIQTSLAEASIICRTSITSKTRHSKHHRHYQANPAKPAVPAESVSLAEARRNSITSRHQHHQQKHVSPAEAIITSTTCRTRHDKQHRQFRLKPAEPVSPAENLRRTSIKIKSQHHWQTLAETNVTSRKKTQNQHQSQKPAS